MRRRARVFPWQGGVSAFRGANADKGVLKAFLDRVESGVIEPGSYLIVESLDRLSRTDITFALQMFLGLINAGIVVVTLADQRVYDRERINDGNFTDIIISLTNSGKGCDCASYF